MLNFRFHIVSLVAVFLSLAIGIIMGSTVIDRALVDTLEDQQRSLRDDLDSISEENQALRGELGELREAGERLASEGGERLLAGTLAETPVLVLAVRGVKSSVLDDLDDLLTVAGARDQGTLWLTDRFASDDEAAAEDLAEVLDLPASASPEELRSEALEQISAAVRAAVAPAAAAEGQVEGTPEGAESSSEGAGGEAGAGGGGAGPVPAELAVLAGLREAGFVEYDAPEGAADDVVDLAVPGTRVVLVSGAGAVVPDRALAAPLARDLVGQGDPGAPVVPLLAADIRPSGDDAGEDEEEEAVPFVGILRGGDVADRLSTVDNLDTFAGRVAAVVALQDLGEGRRGHYGVGPGAERLVPAPEG